jgi:GT2 family glycosyltransferase
MNNTPPFTDAPPTNTVSNYVNGFPLVSVVILNWNGKKYLQQFLPFLLLSTYPNVQFVVADNASTDDSISFLKNNFPQIIIIENPCNEGFAKGYNTALSKITSDYFVLLNSDVEVTPNWIEPAIALMESDNLIAACQPKILSFSNKQQFEYAGASGGWIDGFGYPFSRGRVFDYLEEDRGQFNDASPCFWASGAAMFIKSPLYFKAGGLDNYFFAHQEEIDLCWRLQRLGYKIYVQPASVVYHVGGGTLPKENNLKVYLNFRNNLIMLAKNLPLNIAIYKIPFRMCLDAVAAWKGLLGGSGGYFIAISGAHVQFIKWLLLNKNNHAHLPYTNNKFTGWYNGSAIWQHFVKKKTTFLQIINSK